MKTFVKITVNLLLLLMMLATLLGGAYWYSWQQNVPVSAIQVKFSKDQTKIGEPVTAEILVQTPWYRNVEESLIFSSATDDVKFLEGQIDIQLKSIGIHGRVWQIKTQLLAFAAGSYKDLKVDIPLSPDRALKQNKLVVTLPELTVAANELKGDITFMADIDPQELIEEKISEVQPRPWWHTALYVVATIVIVILIIVIDRKIRHSRKLNYWQQAKKNLDELEGSMPMDPEKFFVVLTDVIRLYIEKRFSLAATEQTSKEFLSSMHAHKAIDDQQKSFLATFTNAADLVKFARGSTQEQELVHSLSRARDFIESTLPQKGGK